jgi:glycosyltransferase involved in cell wall biosynthesis
MEGRKYKILFLTVRYPYPLIGGDRLKPHKLLEHLGANHDTTLISYDLGNTEGQRGIDAIKNLGVRPLIIPLHEKKAGVKALFKFFTPNPAEIDYFQTAEYRKIVKNEIENGDYDIVMGFFMRGGEFIRKYNIPKILIAEDCRVLYQMRSYQETPNFLQKAIRYYEYTKLRKYEPEMMNDFDAVTLVSPEDVEACRKQNPNPDYYVVTNGTDIEKFIPVSDNSKRNGILFTGKLDVQANQIMLKTIVYELLPEILKEVPDAELHVAGALPTSEQRRMIDKYDNIHLHENVPEMVPYLQKARIYLHPHKGGSGIQNKLLEALSAGCPVVTSITGNQGIHAKNGEEAFICKNNEDFIKNTIKVLKDDSTMNRLSKNGRTLMENTHSWDVVYRQIEEIMTKITRK